MGVHKTSFKHEVIAGVTFIREWPFFVVIGKLPHPNTYKLSRCVHVRLYKNVQSVGVGAIARFGQYVTRKMIMCRDLHRVTLKMIFDCEGNVVIYVPGK